jgi:hypothetical protein
MRTPPSFLATLLASPPATPLSRYIVGNGALYLALGLLLLVWPRAMLLFGAQPYEAGEEGLLRTLGFIVGIVGWFYVMGGRTRADSFALATVVDRLIVPFVLVPLALSGAVDPALVLPFAILDPVLAIGAWVVWRRQATDVV